jgi:formylglycine-generating enzyme required for sulfatase activity
MPENSSKPPAVEPGALVGPYRIVGILADGPSGTVFEAVETASGRKVALRRLPKRLGNDPNALEPFLIAAGGRLRHPNVVAAESVERHADDTFLVMEFVGGQTAARSGRLAWRFATRVVRDAARGLSAIHNAGLVHGQVRPGHLIISQDGTAKLADLGVAAADDGPVNPACAAPEQVRGELPDARSDQYALGAVYFTLLTGHSPFADAGNPIDVYDAVLHRAVPTVRAGAPDIPLRCDTIVARAMARDPAARYPSAEAFAADLDLVLAADDTPRPIPLPKLPAQRKLSRRLPGLAVGALVVAALAAGAWYVLGPPGLGQSDKPASRPTPKLPTETNSIGMVLVRVPGGRFRMGDASIPDAPLHPVQVSQPFLIGVNEVTQAQYRMVVGTNPSHFPGDSRPVDSVTWQEAVEFCEKLSARAAEKTAGRSYRLPTEAEWEYACRAGSGEAFGVGPTLPAEKGNSAISGQLATMPVGSYPPNAIGIHDMHGNVWEWCGDWYDAEYYVVSPAIDPPGPDMGTHRVTRGGSWETPPADCRSGYRNDAFAPDARNPAVGFRVVCTVGN